MTRRLVRLISVEKEPGYAWATTRWLRRQVAERRVPYHKCRGKILLDLGDLDAMAEGGRIEAVRTASTRVLGPTRSRRPT